MTRVQLNNQVNTERDAVRNAILQLAYDDARGHLLCYRNRTSGKLPSAFWQLLANLKQNFVKQNDQLSAKAAWCLEAIGKIQDIYITAFWQLRNEEFKDAWNLLEQCEIGVGALDKHFVEENNEFGIEHIRVHAYQLQVLFHLKWGFSPGLLFEEVQCSVCESKRSLRCDCGHEVGEIYNGEMCANVITKAKILHISVVDSPAQKFSMIWPENGFISQFVVLKELADELLSPWDPWRFHKEIRRKHHPAFKGLGRNKRCPCGSDLKYKRCCLKRETVQDFPHFQFFFGSKTRGRFPDLQIFSQNS